MSLASIDQTKPLIDEETLRRLYIEERLSIKAVAERLGSKSKLVSRFMARYNIESRGGGRGPSRHIFTKLKIGESLMYPMPRSYANLYKISRGARIRISVNKIDVATVKVTRIS